MRAPLKLSRPTGKALRHIELVRRRFHIAEFGEELARVNLDMTKEQRHRYLDWMREAARRHGVKREQRFPFDRDYEE
jgi:hypothetical protein